MPGLFDSLFSDDNASQLALATGLLGGRGSFNQILGGALNQGALAGQGASARKRQAELDDLTKQKFKLALDEEQRKKAQYDKAEAFRASIAPPSGLEGVNWTGGQLGPTPDRASQVKPINPQDKFAYGAMQAGLMSPLDYQQRGKKELIPVAPGASLYNPTTNSAVFTNPKEDANDPFVRLLMQAGVDPKSEQGVKLLQQRLQKESTHQEPINISNYGTPLPVQLPGGGTGYLQPPTRPGAPTQMLNIPGTNTPAMKPKEQSATLQKDIAENSVALGKLDAAMDLLGKNPGAIGAQNIVGDAIMQRADPKGVETRAAIADIGSQKIHDRSGASVTISEAPRLKPFVPDVRDTPEAAEIKLGRLRSEYAAMQSALTNGASISQAAKPAGVPKASGWSIEKE